MEKPITRDAEGVLWWEIAGRRFPVIAGADEGDGDGGDGDGGAGEGEGAAGGTGEKPPGEGSVTDPEKQKLHQEAATHRRRVRELEAEVAKMKEKDLSEAEKLQKRATEAEAKAEAAEARAREASIRAHVIAAAVGKDIIDPEAAFLLLDRKSLEADDDGEPTNVGELLDELVKAKPYLVKAGEEPPEGDKEKPKGGGTPNPAAGRKGQLTAKDLKGMTTEQIRALPQDEVNAALART